MCSSWTASIALLFKVSSWLGSLKARSTTYVQQLLLESWNRIRGIKLNSTFQRWYWIWNNRRKLSHLVHIIKKTSCVRLYQVFCVLALHFLNCSSIITSLNYCKGIIPILWILKNSWTRDGFTWSNSIDLHCHNENKSQCYIEIFNVRKKSLLENLVFFLLANLV